MIIINNINDIETTDIKNIKNVVFSYIFLTIYGLPFCTLYSRNLLILNYSLSIALEVNKEQGTATLAIIENFPNLIINANLKSELEIIKQNSKSITQLFTSLQEFNNYTAYLLLKNK